MWIKDTCRLFGELILKICVRMFIYQSQRWRVLGLNFLLPWMLLQQHLHSVEDALKGKKEQRIRVSDVAVHWFSHFLFSILFSYLAYLLQWGHEVIITNQSQSIKHVDGLQGKKQDKHALNLPFLSNLLLEPERRSRWRGIHEGSGAGQVILTQRTCSPTAPSMRSLLVK